MAFLGAAYGWGAALADRDGSRASASWSTSDGRKEERSGSPISLLSSSGSSRWVSLWLKATHGSSGRAGKEPLLPINLSTARGFGVTIPPSADEVIEW